MSYRLSAYRRASTIFHEHRATFVSNAPCGFKNVSPKKRPEIWPFKKVRHFTHNKFEIWQNWSPKATSNGKLPGARAPNQQKKRKARGFTRFKCGVVSERIKFRALFLVQRFLCPHLPTFFRACKRRSSPLGGTDYRGYKINIPLKRWHNFGVPVYKRVIPPWMKWNPSFCNPPILSTKTPKT